MRQPFLASDHPRYKWVALSNTTLGTLMATISGSIVLISLPAIFKGIELDALQASNVSYLLWMIMGYLLVTAVFVVAFGRLGDMYGRVRIYNLGFLVFTLAAIGCAAVPYQGGAGALWLIVWRLVQAVGGAMLFANSTAIITDAFPADRRGLAMGINQVAAIAGSFVGLVLGGVLAVVHWRAVFLVSVPVGVVGTIWAYASLHEAGERNPGRLDWPGNVTFSLGLTALLAASTYGIQPYGGQPTGWTNPWVLAGLIGGVAVLGLFVWVELRSPAPMLDLRLFRIRAFSAGNLASLLAAIGRGGLQFMLIIWLQGIWLPLHGYAYEDTPLWAGIYMLPITLGFLVAGPISGTLSDRFGARGFASVGLLVVAGTFVLYLLMPVNFEYWQFAVVSLLSGIGSGMFGAPNRTAIMNSVPASERGAASGVSATVQNAGSSMSIGVFFSLMVVGLAGSLPTTLRDGLLAHGVPDAVAGKLANLPPVDSLFAAFLGYNPIESLLGPSVLGSLDPADAAALTGKEFFPQLISGPFHDGLVVVFVVAAVMSFIGALASLSRGKRFVHDEHVGALGRTLEGTVREDSQVPAVEPVALSRIDPGGEG
ncbi:MFS transporter [Propionicimonas sp.]|uniref:MFS transporter n=1 Tax=Propionicimonas sp. TaxID=1955623 RepID=UPI0039E2901A